jgi:predicted RNA binding protein YcfA (HicA-like mRNA interferase family)
MPKVPILKPREVAAKLTKLGFVQVRQRGSHPGGPFPKLTEELVPSLPAPGFTCASLGPALLSLILRG